MFSSAAMAQSADKLMFGGRLGKQNQGNISWEADLNFSVLDVEYTQFNNNVDYITSGYTLPF